MYFRILIAFATLDNANRRSMYGDGGGGGMDDVWHLVIVIDGGMEKKGGIRNLPCPPPPGLSSSTETHTI